MLWWVTANGHAYDHLCICRTWLLYLCHSDCSWALWITHDEERTDHYCPTPGVSAFHLLLHLDSYCFSPHLSYPFLWSMNGAKWQILRKQFCLCKIRKITWSCLQRLSCSSLQEMHDANTNAIHSWQWWLCGNSRNTPSTASPGPPTTLFHNSWDALF